MRSTTLKPLLNLAAAAILAQSGTVPEWGEHLLSCGFTNALRTIESVETVKGASSQARVTEEIGAVPEQLDNRRRKTMDYFDVGCETAYIDDFLYDELMPEIEDERITAAIAEMITITREAWIS